MFSVNTVTLIGNVGKEPDVTYTETGSMKVSFSLATNDFYKSKTGERISKTEWHNIILWGKLAVLAKKYLVKGKHVYIEGRLTSRPFENISGEKKYITEIVGKNMILLGAGKYVNTNDNHNQCYEQSGVEDDDFNY